MISFAGEFDENKVLYLLLCVAGTTPYWFFIQFLRAHGFRKKFNDSCARIDALKLYVADESGKQLATTELKLEDLSYFYGDESERWLHVDFGK